MNITRVAVRPVEMNKVKAMVSITIDDSFVVHGLRVVEGERGFFVAMPSRRLPSGEYRALFHQQKFARALFQFFHLHHF